MKRMFRTLLITSSLLACGTVQAEPYNRVLPAAVNDNSGNLFWCDAHRQVTGKCEVMSVDRMVNTGHNFNLSFTARCQ